LLVVVLLICLPAFAAADSGILNVGADMDYPPYSFVDSRGEPTGFDIEFMQLLANRMGLETSFTLGPWAEVLTGLEVGRHDVVVSAMFTVSRSEDFIFSASYNSDTISIFVAKDSQIEDIADLDGRRVASLEGDAIPETILYTHGVHARINYFPTFTEALQSVSKGESDYALVPHNVGMEIAKRAGIRNLTVTGPPVHTIQYHLALHPDQSELRIQLDREIESLVEDAAYAELRRRWLHHERRELSPTAILRYTAPVVIPVLVLLLVAWVVTLKRQVNRQTQEIQALATKDELTGLANRRLFDAIAEKEFLRARRRGDRFAILFLDLDHFKTANDEHGHVVGDDLLSRFARRCESSLREYDLLARYGGEEFVGLLRDADLDEARWVAERVAEECRSRRFSTTSGRSVRLTVSIGVAVTCDDDTSFRDTLARADAALYRAKEAGRDRVELDVRRGCGR
jgi:diguanylate cyclase (GGDEF)-like protein